MTGKLAGKIRQNLQRVHANPTVATLALAPQRGWLKLGSRRRGRVWGDETKRSWPSMIEDEGRGREDGGEVLRRCGGGGGRTWGRGCVFVCCASVETLW